MFDCPFVKGLIEMMNSNIGLLVTPNKKQRACILIYERIRRTLMHNVVQKSVKKIIYSVVGYLFCHN